MEDNEEMVSLEKIDLDLFIPEGCAIAGLLEGAYQDIEKYGKPKEYAYLITLVETYFFCKISLLEAISYQRGFEHASSDIEKATCLTYFDIIVGEGTTYLCGYEIGKGSHKLSKIKNEMPKCKEKGLIINICETYIASAQKEGFFSTLKKDKNNAKHYSPDIIKVNEHLKSIQKPDTFNRICLYLNMVNQLTKTIADYLDSGGYLEVNKIEEDGLKCIDVPVEIVVLDDSIDRVESLIIRDEQMMFRFAEIEGLNRKILDYENCGIINHITAEDLFSGIEFFINVSKSVWHLSKVRLDFNYAIRDYHTSSNKLEQRAHLYRALLSLYEGCKLMVEGYPDDGIPPLIVSMHKYISDCRDNRLNALERKIKRELKSFYCRLKEDYSESRDYWVHARDDKNKDKILQKFYWMLKVKPSKLIEDTMSFFDIIDPLWIVVDVIMSQNHPDFWQSYKSSLFGEVENS